MTALIVVDVQYDFLPGGALAVPDGDAIIPIVNRLLGAPVPVVFTQDWHPRDHLSFASQHDGRAPFETIQMPYGEQVLWPDHCVQGSTGAEFHPDLDRVRADVVLRKGFRREIDSYSAFRENDHETRTGLAGYLRERGIDRVALAGLATDFCVLWSVQDAHKEGFEITVIEDAVRGIDLEGSVGAAWRTMRELGAEIIGAEQWLDDVAASQRG